VKMAHADDRSKAWGVIVAIAVVCESAMIYAAPYTNQCFGRFTFEELVPPAAAWNG